MGKRSSVVLAVLAPGVLALSLVACKPAPKVPARPTPQVLVKRMQPEPVTLRSELPGRTAAHQIAEIRPQVSGLIRERLFTEGARVTAGQVLYQIEPAPFEADLEQAEAALASARAAARLSELLVQRYRGLLPIRSISQQEFDRAEAVAAQDQASVRLRQAAATAARIQLQRTRITAPITGRTGRSLVTPGALVSANQAAALTTIAQLDPIYVDLTQSSADLLRLRQAANAGQIKRGEADTRKVSLVLEDGTAYPQEGRLQLSEVTVDATTGSVLLRAVFSNPDGLLLPGMYVRAMLAEGVAERGLLVPQQAITRDRKGGATVRIVNAESKLELRTLTTSRAIGSDWLVNAGLEAGDRVVIEGAAAAQPGTLVEVVDGPGAATPRAP